MISDLIDNVAAGRFLKPHGISGEIVATTDLPGLELKPGACVIVEIDGLKVPFFIEAVRRKGDNYLLKLDGITDETEASELALLPYSVPTADAPEDNHDFTDDGFYASDLIGFKASEDTTDGQTLPLGTITDIEDSTANALFIIATTEGGTLYVPVADDYITDINPEDRTITFSLPEGLKQL